VLARALFLGGRPRVGFGPRDKSAFAPEVVARATAGPCAFAVTS